MKQKSTLSQTPKPKIIKLTPYTPLPKLRIAPLTPSPYIDSSSITSKSKAKTEPSAKEFLSKERVKTQSMIQQKEEESASFRLISRFIYNHLQKKLNFHTQIANHFSDAFLPNETEASSLDSDSRLRQEIFSNKHNKHQSYIINPIREASHSQLLKFRNKLSLRAKAIQRSLAKDQANEQRNRKRYANIDSYFDLSCLDSCSRRERG